MTFHDLLPFAFGFIVTALQPTFDEEWLTRFKTVFNDEIYNNAAGARWAADTSQFLPTASITLVGIALLLPADNPTDVAILLGLVSIGMLTLFRISLSAARKKTPRLEEPVRTEPGFRSWLRYRVGYYSPLQYLLLAMNAASGTYVILFH